MLLNKIMMLLVFLCWSALAAGTPTHVDLEVSATRDDNLSRAESSRDSFGDSTVGVGISVMHTIMLTPYSGLKLKGGLRHESHAEYHELDNTSASIGASYRIQPVMTYTAPWIELGGSIERLSFNDSDIRDGRKTEIEAIVGKRFTDRIAAQVGIGREFRSADDMEVFDWQRTRLFAKANYRVGMDSTLYASLSRDIGDQVFTATPNPRFRKFAKAIADDPAFGKRRAYRLDAVSESIELGLSMPVNGSNTLDIGIFRFRADADGDHTYDDTQLRASWLYRFR